MSILINAMFELLECTFFANMFVLIFLLSCFSIVYNFFVPCIRRDDE